MTLLAAVLACVSSQALASVEVPTSTCSAVSAIDFPECSADAGTELTITTSGQAFVSTAQVQSNDGDVVSTRTTAGDGSNCTFYWATQGIHTGDVYGEISGVTIDNGSAAGWISGIGSGSSGGHDTNIETGDIYLKMSGYEGKSLFASVFGAANAQVKANDGNGGNIYIHVAATDNTLTFTNATYGSVSGCWNATVDGSLSILIDNGEFGGTVYAGDASNSSKVIGGGTQLTIADGTYKSIVSSAGKIGTINNGTQLVIENGTFENVVTGGGTSCNGTLAIKSVAECGGDENSTTAVAIDIKGGTFQGLVSGTGDSSYTAVTGDVDVFIEKGDFQGQVVGAGSAGNVTGDVMLVITGGTFTADVVGGSTGATLTGDVAVYVTDGTFSGKLVGSTNAITGNVDLAIAGGTFDNCTGIYADEAQITGNTTVEVYGNALDKFQGVIDGGTVGTDNTRTLLLEGASLSNATVQNFDKIQVTENGSLSLDAVAADVTLDASSTLSLTEDVTLADKTISGGNVNVADGKTLTVNAENALSGVAVSLGTDSALDLTAAKASVTALSGAGAVKLGANDITLSGDSAFSGTIEGTGTLAVEGGESTLASAGSKTLGLSVKDATVTLDAATVDYKKVTVEQGGKLIVGATPAATSSLRALRAATSAGSTQLNVGDDGLTVASGATLSLTLNADSAQALQSADPVVTSKGAIDLQTGSTLELTNASSIASADVENLSVTLMTSETSVSLGSVTLSDKVLNALYTTELVADNANNSILLVGEQVKQNIFVPGNTTNNTNNTANNTDSSVAALPVNATAGANLLWNARFDLGESSNLKDAFVAVLDQQAAGDDTAANKTLAAIAGSTINATGTAQRDALRDQLNTIRDRALALSTDGSEQGHHFWIEGNGGYNHLRTRSDKGGYKLSTWGGTVGADLVVDKDLTFGAAFTANTGDLRSEAAERATGDLDSLYLNLFGHYQDDAWGHTLVITGTTTDASLDRTVNYGEGSYRTHGDTNGYGFGALYELTYDIALNDRGTNLLQPLFNASIVRTQLDAYNESGAGNAGLNVGKQEWTTGMLALGARWSGTFGTKTIGQTIFGELRAAVSQEFGDKQGKTAVSFAGAPNFGQNVYGAKEGATAFQISGGLSTKVSDNGSVYVNAGAEVRNSANAVHGNLGYRYSF